MAICTLAYDKSAYKNAQKSSKNSKPSIHKVVSTETNFAKKMAFLVPTGCVRLASYCGKMYSGHIFLRWNQNYPVVSFDSMS